MNNVNSKDVLLKNVDKNNLDIFLSIYKEASLFSAMYKSMDGLWDTMKYNLLNNFYSESTYTNLICSTTDDIVYGLIQLEYCDSDMPSINISLRPQFRGLGIGKKASKLFVDKIFDQFEYEPIRWEAFKSTETSIKIAQSLGGIASEELGDVAQYLKSLSDAIDKELEINTVHFIISRSN